MAKDHGFLRATMTLGLFRVLQQLLFFGQLAYFLYVFGSTGRTDALIIAQTLPLFLAVFFKIAVANTFIPLYAQWREQRGEEDAYRLASAAMLALLGVAVGLSTVIFAAAPLITRMLAPGLPPADLTLSAGLLRCLCPFIAIAGMCGIPRAVYFSHRFFIVPAATSVLVSATTILAMFLFADVIGIHSVVLGSTAGVLAELAFLFLFLNHGERRFRFLPGSAREGLAQFRRLIGPRIVMVAIARLNVIIDRIFASTLGNASVSVLAYAARIQTAPVELVNASFGTAAYVDLSRDAAGLEIEQFKARLARYARGVTFLIVPVMVLLVVLAQPAISVLFGRGEFGPDGVELTAAALAFYSLGILPSVIGTTLRGSFLALQDVMTPLKVAAVGMLLNVGLNFLLINPLAIRGLALATALSEWARMFLLIWATQKKFGGIEARDFSRIAGKLLLAGGAMAVVVWLFSGGPLAISSGGTVLIQFVHLAAVGSLGALVYLFVSWLLRVKEATVLFSGLRRMTLG